MGEYVLKVKLLSDSIFGSGESVSGVVDQDVLFDSWGFPFMKGKTVKGKLREEFVHVIKCVSKGNIEKASELTDKIFGTPDGNSLSCLKVSDLCIEENIRKLLIYGVRSGAGFDANDISNSLTSIRNFTSIDYKTGAAKEGSLRRIRVINGGLVFESIITVDASFTENEECELAAAVASLKHLGAMETRGKGFVKCSLWKNGIDITKNAVERLQGGIA